mmetsp:Transcript_21990/g.59313  ORF Transcript_21990/g.59313 Transcript_21990/m.59313 type:complete len:84 (+) Transcript_21990:876-1127(+)
MALATFCAGVQSSPNLELWCTSGAAYPRLMIYTIPRTIKQSHARGGARRQAPDEGCFSGNTLFGAAKGTRQGRSDYEINKCGV